MMKELTVKQIQNVCLKIMKEIHAFCVQNNIRYSLAYGSMIGAATRKHFVPWDDDLDIFMPRPDYERFCKTYKSDSTKVFASCIGNSYINYGRVCDMVETYVDTHTAWATQKTGVWVDVFPIDGISCSNNDFKDTISRLCALETKLYYARGAKGQWNTNRSILYNLKKFAKKVLYSHYNIRNMQSCYNKTINQCNFEESIRCGKLSHPPNCGKELYHTEIFKDYFLTDFCDTKFYMLRNYDYVLKNFYGDYTKLPPKEKRVPKHTSNLYYWKQTN